MKVIWLGQNGLLFISGKTKVLVDPYLSDSLRHYDNTKVRRWAINKKFHTVEPDVIALTSSRPDHTDTETLRHYINGNKQLVTVLCCEGAFKKISSAGFGGRLNKVFMDNSSHWTHDNMYFQAVPAYTNESGAFGIIITDAYDGKKYYVTSNTVYTEDIFKYIPKDIDTLFIPISGEAGGMDTEKASYFARRVNAKHTVPLKFGMFDTIDPSSLDADNLIVPVIYKIIPLDEEDAFAGSPISVSKADKENSDGNEKEAIVQKNQDSPSYREEPKEEIIADPNEAKTKQEEKAEKMENIKDTEYIKENLEKADTSPKKEFDPFETDKFDGTLEIDSARFAVAFATLESIEKMSNDENLVSVAPVTQIDNTDDEIVVVADTKENDEDLIDIKASKPAKGSDNPFDDPNFDFRQFVYNPDRKKEDIIKSINSGSLQNDVKPFVLFDEEVKKEDVQEAVEIAVEETVEDIVEEAVVEEAAEETVEEIVEEPVEDAVYEEVIEEKAEDAVEEATLKASEEAAEEVVEETYTEEDRFNDMLFEIEEDCDYDEEFYRKDREYDLKYAIVHGEFYDEDENEADELDALDGEIGDSNNEELYADEREISFEQIALVDETAEDEDKTDAAEEEAPYEQVSLFEESKEENAEDVDENEEATEEIVEETIEESVEDSIESTEEPVEEIVEEMMEEPAEEKAEEAIEEVLEEIPKEAAEEVVEELVEEEIAPEEEETEIEILYDEDGNEICTYDGVVMHYPSDADDEELLGFDVGDDYYDYEPEGNNEDVSHIIDAYVKELEKLDNGEDVDFNSIVF